MPNHLTPGVYFETADTSRRGITAIRTDIAAFIGIAERGPLHRPTRVESQAQFQSIFGNFIPGGYLAYSAKAFFENGGRTCFVVRVASGSAAAAQVILCNRYGEPALRVWASSPGSWGNQISLQISPSIPAATRTPLDSRGDHVPQPQDREASLVESVVGFPIGSLVRIFQPGLMAPDLRLVTGRDELRCQLTWDEPLLQAIDLNQQIYFEVMEFSLTVYRQGHLQANYPGLSMHPKHPRYLCEVINTEEPSGMIRVEDLSAGLPEPDRMVQLRKAELPQGRFALIGGLDGLRDLRPEHFTGGLESANPCGLRTLEKVDEVAIVAIPDILIEPVAVRPAPEPGPEPDPCLTLPKNQALARLQNGRNVHDLFWEHSLSKSECAKRSHRVQSGTPETPSGFSLEDVFEVQRALVEHCERMKDRIALLDPPISNGQVDFDAIQAWRLRFDSTYAALYYPWVLVYDPLRLNNQVVRAIPPSGHVAGLYARTDLEVGVHKAPANLAINWVQDVAIEVSPEFQGVLNPLGVNCIRGFPGRGIRAFGARTVSSKAQWRYVNVRRLLMMIEEAIEVSIQWSVFEPNDIYLWQALSMAISNFLAALWSRGALAGETEERAFQVRCDETTMTQDDIDNGRLIAEVRVAPTLPAEFVILRIGRTEQELEISELVRA